MDKINSSMFPSNSDCVRIGEEAISENSMLIILGKCIIDYEGRSVTEGYMPEGERLVFLKKDGTMHVHSTTKKSPIRYQNSGAKASIKEDNGEVILETIGRNKGTKDVVTVFFSEIYQISSFNAIDNKVSSASDLLRGTEKDMKKYIKENPDYIEDGFKFIEEEKETEEGPVDIFGKDKEGNPVILELKARHAQKSHVRQLNSYVRHYKNSEVRGFLVAPSIADTAMEKMRSEDFIFIELNPLEDIDGDSSNSKLSEYN